jgi:oligopeptide/dipeptide ABC transporter ATP-binding protein
MYLGRIVEIASADKIFARPRHPYTRALLAAAPSLEPGAQIGGGMIEGEPPNPRNLPSGCAFRTRCPYAIAACAEAVPELAPTDDDMHRAACIRWKDVAADDVASRAPLPSKAQVTT